MIWDEHQAGNRRQAMARSLVMHRKIGEKIQSLKKKDRLIEIIILILSVLVAGAFWVLIGDTFPTSIKWLGAIISTVLTGLTIYQSTIGPKNEFEKTLKLYSNLGLFLAKTIENPRNFNWNDFKLIETEYTELISIEPTDDDINNALLIL